MEVAALIGRHHRNWIKRRESLKEATAASNTVLDRLPDPLLLLDSSRMIVRGNDAARELFGPNIHGRDLSAALRNPDVLAAADEVLAGREEAAVELALTAPVEREFLAGITSLPVPTSDGTVAILRLHDLTEIKRTEQMRADFVANVSHELKTPLTTLLGYIETLQGPAKDDAQAKERFLGIMAQQAARMNRLVDDLLSLSRIQLHEHKAPTGRVDLGQLLGTITDIFEVKARAKRQKIELIRPPDLPPDTFGDPVELSQVFENLLENAVRYGAPNSTIRITMAPVAADDGTANGRIAVAVADEGAGIPREHLPRLTERFYRVDPARSRELGGTGLGLAIVKHIVNRHRGDLKIESEVGKGSTFTVILPSATAKP
jgi:two-component system phosphate regulon sensor histidine kinase PhoR